MTPMVRDEYDQVPKSSVWRVMKRSSGLPFSGESR